MLLDEIYDIDLVPKYQKSGKLAEVKGADKAKLNQGELRDSMINKLHIMKLVGIPSDDIGLRDNELYKRVTFTDLCMQDTYSQSYDPDDFIYCKNFGLPMNHLITLRRFPYACTDNLYDKEWQGEPDVARLVTYFHQDVNKLDELLAFSYNIRWKELQSEMESSSMQGDQSGFSGFLKKIYQVIDPNLWENKLRGDNANMVDPKFDQNKVYGPVNSITNTNIRDVGVDFSKEFDLVFEYDLKSIAGRTPEYAMKDILANVLAATHVNTRFWPGSRYWVGERPSQFYTKYQHMNSDNMDTLLFGAMSDLKNAVKQFASKGSALETIKKIITGSAALALGKIADTVGRASIPTSNSLLSGEPTGEWHVTIGNPLNPIMCIGNLLLTGVDIKFPTDTLSYGDFPTTMQVSVKLKPGMGRGRAEIEMMFNTGQQRIYWAPAEIKQVKNKVLNRDGRNFLGLDNAALMNLSSNLYDFLAKEAKVITTTVKEKTGVDLAKAGDKIPDKGKSDVVNDFAFKGDGYKSNQTAFVPWTPKDETPKPIVSTNQNYRIKQTSNNNKQINVNIN